MIKTISTIIFLLLMCWFCDTVTLKHAPESIAWETQGRINQVNSVRPWYKMFSALNGHLFDDAVVFQSGFDNYRAYCEFSLTGRPSTNCSWRGYQREYPENTAINLHKWLTSQGAGFIMVMSGNEFILPIDDPMFPTLFLPLLDGEFEDGRGEQTTTLYSVGEIQGEN